MQTKKKSSTPYDPAIHNRQSIRMRGHDYAGPGQYFVTMNTADRKPRFGTVVKGRMVRNESGAIAAQCWQAIPEHFPNVILGEWVIMPDHVHGIIEIVSPSRSDIGKGEKSFAPSPLPPRHTTPLRHPRGTSRTLGSIVRGFKIGVTKAVGIPAWQRNYYDIIIRDDTTLRNIQQYIRNNPENYDAVMNCGEPKTLGNRALLDGPKLGFLASRGETVPHGNLPLKGGEAIISGFLSPMERAVFKAGLERNKALIWVKPWGLETGTLSSSVRRALNEGRLLILSPFENAIEAPSVRRAAWCNAYVMEHCNKLVIGHLTPGGMLDCLLSDAPPELNVIPLNP